MMAVRLALAALVMAVVSLFMKGETYTSNYRDKFLGIMMVGV
jgi:hypothetical protein